ACEQTGVIARAQHLHEHAYDESAFRDAEARLSVDLATETTKLETQRHQERKGEVDPKHHDHRKDGVMVKPGLDRPHFGRPRSYLIHCAGAKRIRDPRSTSLTGECISTVATRGRANQHP